jgi:hypothetical protein
MVPCHTDWPRGRSNHCGLTHGSIRVVHRDAGRNIYEIYPFTGPKLNSRRAWPVYLFSKVVMVLQLRLFTSWRFNRASVLNQTEIERCSERHRIHAPSEPRGDRWGTDCARSLFFFFFNTAYAGRGRRNCNGPQGETPGICPQRVKRRQIAVGNDRNPEKAKISRLSSFPAHASTWIWSSMPSERSESRISLPANTAESRTNRF